MKYKTKIWIEIVVVLQILISCSAEKRKESQPDNSTMPGMIMISDNDRLLAGIRTAPVAIKNISELTTLVGTTAIDERQVNILASRVKGRLDELFVKNPGEYVKHGQAVYAIYSEELLADENDYLLALDQYEKAVTQKKIAKVLVEAARKRLLLWTLTDDQVNELAHSRKATSLIKFYSPYNGYVMELSVREGEYVEAGTPMLKLSNLNTLWIETQVYTDEVKYLKQNPSMQIEFEAYLNEVFKGEIAFENPVIEENQKINLVRVQVSNGNHKLKPGMMAYLYLKRNEKRGLVIPKSALLVESTVSVWVENKDGMFEQRMVRTGIENKKEVEILSGIQAGERVVVSGAFFLKSESVIKQGGGTMSGMKM